jgi:hypothetical protein
MHSSPSEVLDPDDDSLASPLDPELLPSELELSSLSVSVSELLDSVDAPELLVDTLPDDDDPSSVSAGGSLPPHAVAVNRTSRRSFIAPHHATRR